jgi:hypothetical protein
MSLNKTTFEFIIKVKRVIYVLCCKWAQPEWVSRSYVRIQQIKFWSILPPKISPEIYSWLLDMITYVYADKIRIIHSCGCAKSTRVTQSPLSPLAMSFLTLYFVCLCLSIIMLNPLNTLHEYKPVTSICLLIETHVCNVACCQ